MVAVKNSEADRFIARPPPNIFLYLVFGTDAGLVAERAQQDHRAQHRRCRKTRSSFCGSPATTSPPIRCASRTRPTRFRLFGGRRAIAIDAQGKSFVAALEPVLAKPPRDCTIVIEAGASETRRAAAPNSANPMPMRAATRMLSGFAPRTCRTAHRRRTCAPTDLAIDPEAQTLLVSLLGQDRLTTRAEIGKLALYARGAGNGDGRSYRGDRRRRFEPRARCSRRRRVRGRFRCRGRNRRARLFRRRRLQRAARRGARHATMLHRAGSMRKRARSANEPGNFGSGGFRRSAAFDRHVRAWTSDRLARVIAALSQAIGKARRDPRLADLIAVRALWAVALTAKRKPT